MSFQLSIPALGISESQAQERFDALQKRLVPLWRAIESLDDEGEQTIVVVPSLTVDYAALQGSVLQAYEERFLFLLLLLRQPRARLIFITSQSIHPNVVDYYLGLLPRVISSHARSRLHLLAPRDGAAQPLSIKLLQRPYFLAKIRSLIPDPHRAHLIPFNTTTHERDLALRLGIPLYGADPKHLDYGTKSGCRRLFAETGVAHPQGIEGLSSLNDLVDAAIEMRRRDPDIRHAMVKHNDGVSGEGNAIVRLEGLEVASRDAVIDRLRTMELASIDLNIDDFLDKLFRLGGVIEERIEGASMTSPSVQLRTTPRGEVELLSTHDQLLGGPGGQTFVGCSFPADSAYANLIGEEALKVGRRLAKENVLGRYAIDFICARQGDIWKTYAIELNLRKGGTTHPFLTLQFLTDGQYNPATNVFETSTGNPKFYVATDSLRAEEFRAFTPDDLFDIVVRHGLHYDANRQAGIVLHMMSAVGDHGRIGFTAVADSASAARVLYQRTEKVLLKEARAALAPKPLS